MVLTGARREAGRCRCRAATSACRMHVGPWRQIVGARDPIALRPPGSARRTVPTRGRLMEPPGASTHRRPLRPRKAFEPQAHQQRWTSIMKDRALAGRDCDIAPAGFARGRLGGAASVAGPAAGPRAAGRRRWAAASESMMAGPTSTRKYSISALPILTRISSPAPRSTCHPIRVKTDRPTKNLQARTLAVGATRTRDPFRSAPAERA